MTGRYEQLVESTPDGIVVHDGERIVEVNAALVRLSGASGREQLIGQPVADLLEHPYLRAVEQQLLAARAEMAPASMVHDRLHRLDGKVRDVEVQAQLFFERGTPRAHVVVRDITERLVAERLLRERAERLRADEKLQEIRMLAGGVAHEINNMLQIILGFAGMLAEQPLTRDQLADVEEIARAAARGAMITTQLLQYARQAPNAARSVDLCEAVPRMIQAMPYGRTREGLRVTLESRDSPEVWVDVDNLRQMLENLVANAYRATKAEGEISVGVARASVTEERIAGDGRRMPVGEYGTVAVRDTGCGMTPEVQRRIFDPFFTTSPVGEGSGLGLAAVQGLLAQNGGFLTVVSAPNVGSTFTLWFPISADPAGEQPTLPGESIG